MDQKRTYAKVDDSTFTIEQDVNLKDSIEILEQFQYLQTQLMNLKRLIEDAKWLQNQFIKIAQSFNLWVAILDEAKKECWFDYKIPDQVVIPKWFNILWTNPESLPKIEFDWPTNEKKEENKSEK